MQTLISMIDIQLKGDLCSSKIFVSRYPKVKMCRYPEKHRVNQRLVITDDVVFFVLNTRYPDHHTD